MQRARIMHRFSGRVNQPGRRASQEDHVTRSDGATKCNRLLAQLSRRVSLRRSHDSDLDLHPEVFSFLSHHFRVANKTSPGSRKNVPTPTVTTRGEKPKRSINSPPR